MKKVITLLAFTLNFLFLEAQNYVTITDTSFASWLQVNIPNAMNGNQMDTTHIDIVSRKKIIFQNQHIIDLNGIQYFDSLTTFDCSDYVFDTLNISISNIPSLPPLLDTLICDGNALDSLPALPAGLIYMSCSRNSLDSLPILPNSLKYLECLGNQLTVLPLLSDSLSHLNCSENLIDSLPPLPSALTTLTCSSNKLQTLPNLPLSLTKLKCASNLLTQLPSLPPGLTDLNCNNNPYLTYLPTLPGSLINLTCSSDSLTSLPALPSTLILLDCSYNHIANLPPLPNALYKMNCSSNPLVNLPALPNSLSILICNDDQLSGLPSLPGSLSELYCTQNAINALPALPASLNILWCNSNQLTSLPTLPSGLTTLHCEYNQLNVLPAQPSSLTFLQCQSNQLSNLPVLSTNLQVLNCASNQLSNIPSLPNSLHYLMCNNNQITALPVLPANLGTLDCSYNFIHCFDVFQNIPGYFNISNNPFTCLPNYIPSMDSITLLYPLCGAGNPFNCPSTYGIVGFTYKDINPTCMKDSGDMGLKNIPLKLYDSSQNLIRSTYTAVNGVYQFMDSAGTYEVMVDNTNKPFVEECVNPGLDSSVTVAVLDTNINFALRCKNGFDVGIQSISTCGIVFPGQTHLLRINAGDISKWYNLNCASGIGGVVSFAVSGPVNYVGQALNSLTPTVSGNIFTYNISDFASVNNQSDFQIYLQPYTNAQAGDLICITAKVTPMNGDNNLSNNQLTMCYSVVNSHDPNIKEVYPVDVAPGFNDWLTYTIHFQNTGNAPAFNILLKDTLDPQLDLSTFEVLDYSHANSTTLNGRILSVYYPNILLPDSATNPEGSIGFVQYRLKPKSGWIRPYKIKNTAYIYFDFNHPIITNTTYNSILDITTGIKEEAEFEGSVYPNPSNGFFTVNTNSTDRRTILVFDTHGTLLLNQKLEGSNEVNASHLSAGVYLIQIQGKTGVKNKKLVIVK